MRQALQKVQGDPAVVALGGGHGLANALRALRRVSADVTAIVGVADDGGSSGRLRAEFDVLPPGDLRMALAALCSDDMWGQTWSRVIQHRFGGEGELAGHSLGNLLMTALWQVADDPVAGLTWMAALLEAHGTVLPCSTTPITINAELQDGATIAGQVSVATAVERVARVWLTPEAPPACPSALDAIAKADVIVAGPGSWYTSVLPHFLVPDQLAVLAQASAKRILVTNLDPTADQETHGLKLDAHLRLIAEYAPSVRFDVVIADPRHIDDRPALVSAAADIGATLQDSPVERRGAPGQHDPDLLSVALRAAMGS
jgi:uncharacterized cofD-like protein